MASDGQLDVITATQKAKTATVTSTIVAGYICPSRRATSLFRQSIIAAVPGGHAWNADPVPFTNRADYAANAGDTKVFWGGGPNPTDGFAGQGFYNMFYSNGISYQRSSIKFADIADGNSNTYMVGEKISQSRQLRNGLRLRR